MEKGYWNRKRIYSIRKFTVGACSVLIGTCAVLFGSSLSAGNSVYAEEVAVSTSAESAKEEGMIEEERSDKAVATSESSEAADASPALSTQENSSEKKEENSSSPKPISSGAAIASPAISPHIPVHLPSAWAESITCLTKRKIDGWNG